MAIRSDILLDTKGDPIFVIGADFLLRFYVTTGDPIVASAAATTPITSIKVQPLTQALISTNKVRFGNLVVTLNGNAPVGATTLSVNDPGANLYPIGAIGRKVVDITGWAIEWLLKTEIGDADAAALISKTTAGGTITFSDPTNGQCDVAISRSDTVSGTTVLVTPGYYNHVLERIDSGNYTPLAYGSVFVNTLGAR